MIVQADGGDGARNWYVFARKLGTPFEAFPPHCKCRVDTSKPSTLFHPPSSSFFSTCLPPNCSSFKIKRETGKGEGPWEGGGSLGILGEGPGVVDLQRCWGCPEQSYQG